MLVWAVFNRLLIIASWNRFLNPILNENSCYKLGFQIIFINDYKNISKVSGKFYFTTHNQTNLSSFINPFSIFFIIFAITMQR